MLPAQHLSCAWSGSRSPSSAMYQAACRMLSGPMLARMPSLPRAAKASSLSKGAAGKAVSVSSRAASSGTLHASMHMITYSSYTHLVAPLMLRFARARRSLQRRSSSLAGQSSSTCAVEGLQSLEGRMHEKGLCCSANHEHVWVSIVGAQCSLTSDHAASREEEGSQTWCQ